MQNKGLFGALIAAAAVYIGYRISQMSGEEKRSLKEKAKRFISERFGFGGNNLAIIDEEPVTDRSVIGN